MFDIKTIQSLKFYVYILLDPETGIPFYVGKGKGNRVFDHLNDAKNGKPGTEKLDIIRKILSRDFEIKHLIVRHGLDEKTAYHIESSLIDTFREITVFNSFIKGNIQGGLNSIENGLMSSEEIIRKYNALPLNSIPDNFVIININNSYKRASGEERIYEATKGIWRMNKNKLDSIKYVLSEYKGLIVEVFEVEKWYPIERKYNQGAKRAGKKYFGYGFRGGIAPETIRRLYINKTIAHKKKIGSANPITYNL